MKNIFSGLIITLLFLTFSSNAQSYLTVSIGKKNSVDLTLGGSGLFASVNYNRIVYVSKSYFVNASVGVGVLPFFLSKAIPHQVSFNFGKKRDFLELGVGGTYFIGESSDSGITTAVYSYNLNPSIGYRRHIGDNFVFRFYAMAIMYVSGEYFIEDYPVVPYAGLSFGYRF